MDKVSETFSDRKIYQTRTFDCQSIVFESSCLIDFTIAHQAFLKFMAIGQQISTNQTFIFIGSKCLKFQICLI